MASEKKVILIFSEADKDSLLNADGPAVAKLFAKGAVLTNVRTADNLRMSAASGAKQGETIWEAAKKWGLTVADYSSEYDMCVLDASATGTEETLAAVLQAAGRTTIVVLVAKGLIVFYGIGFAKGIKIDKEICPCTVAPTIAYVANFPVPADCEGPVCYAALKDINLKLNEIKKMQTFIENMESAMERQSRKPWDKHDCA